MYILEGKKVVVILLLSGECRYTVKLVDSTQCIVYLFDLVEMLHQNSLAIEIKIIELFNPKVKNHRCRKKQNKTQRKKVLSLSHGSKTKLKNSGREPC